MKIEERGLKIKDRGMGTEGSFTPSCPRYPISNPQSCEPVSYVLVSLHRGTQNQSSLDFIDASSSAEHSVLTNPRGKLSTDQRDFVLL